MKRTFNRKALARLLAVALLLLAFSHNSGAQVNDQHDADLPPFQTNISKQSYLQEREAFFAERRRAVRPLSLNPRTVAITRMRAMERSQRKDRSWLIQSPDWKPLGPAPIPNGNTRNYAAPTSGRVTAIAIHPANPDIVYIGTASGGVYRSMNGGESWTAIFDQAQSLSIGALALAPSDPSILYVGTGEANLSGDSKAGVGLYRIDNADAAAILTGPINPDITYNTATGSMTVGAFTYRSISKIVVHPADPATIFVATVSGASGNPRSYFDNLVTTPPLAVRGLFRSTNATATADAVRFVKLPVTDAESVDVPATGNRNITDVLMDPADPNHLLCWVYDSTRLGSTTRGGGIYVTTNALSAQPVFKRNYSAALTNAKELARGAFAGVSIRGSLVLYSATGETEGRIIQSLDGGATWKPVRGSFNFCTGQCSYNIALAVDPGDAGKLYVGGASAGNIFRRSLDSGRTFTAYYNGLHDDVHCIAVAPSQTNTIYLGCDGGIFKSINGGQTWTSLNTAGLNATQFQSLALHPKDPHFTIGGTQDNGTILYKPDGTFTRIDAGDGGYALIDPGDTGIQKITMYHTYYNMHTVTGYGHTVGGIGTTENNWTFSGCEDGYGGNGISCTDSVSFYAPMALGPGQPAPVYFGANVLYRSADKGASNQVVSQSFHKNYITSISISSLDDHFRLVGLNNGEVWATANGSAAMVNVTPSGAPTVPVGRVFISPTDKNVAYLCYTGYGLAEGRHIWKTTNLGDAGSGSVRWTVAGNGLPDIPVNCFTMSAEDPLTVYCGTDIGVFISVDGGSNWNSFSSGLPAVAVFDMAIHPVSHVLRIATHGRGLWEVSAAALPTSFSSFTATVKEHISVLLEWYTARELHNRGFVLQRAVVRDSSRSWENIDFVQGSGNTVSPRRYDYTDIPTGGRNFAYRIEQIDSSGSFSYSEERDVLLDHFDFALFPAYPNPVAGTATIRYQIPENGPVSLCLYNSSGALINWLINETKEAGIYETTLKADRLPAGIYFISLRSGSYYNTKRVVIMH